MCLEFKFTVVSCQNRQCLPESVEKTYKLHRHDPVLKLHLPESVEKTYKLHRHDPVPRLHLLEADLQELVRGKRMLGSPFLLPYL